VRPSALHPDDPQSFVTRDVNVSLTLSARQSPQKTVTSVTSRSEPHRGEEGFSL
jgi:hypothetical protein